jgi:hypothetical protein
MTKRAESNTNKPIRKKPHKEQSNFQPRQSKLGGLFVPPNLDHWIESESEETQLNLGSQTPYSCWYFYFNGKRFVCNS